ncbi:MAG: zinc dependent phospholipase C family protein, partial [Candidatus Bathyarchaeia archaeon]
MKRRVYVLTLLLTLLIQSHLIVGCYAWGNGGYSSDPSSPKYGTHDWIAEHALDWLPSEAKQWITANLNLYLYGTELPDNGRAPDGIGDTGLHHIYFSAGGALVDDAAARRANETFSQALALMLSGDFASAAKYAGAMTHYIADMAVFGHVMGSGTDWGAELHHSDYEEYVGKKTSWYYSEWSAYLSFDGDLRLITAYDAAVELAYDTTFDRSGRGLTCVWMDENYNWSNPIFVARALESLNLAVNYITDVLYTLYTTYVAQTTKPVATVTFFANGINSDAGEAVLTVDGVSFFYSQLPASFTWEVGSSHSFEWKSPIGAGSGKQYVWVSTSGLSAERSGTIIVPPDGGSVQATCKTQYKLTVSVSPSGAGTTSPAPGDYWYDAGSSVSVSATANAGYAFSHWLLDGSNAGSSNPISVTMSAPHTLTAVFTEASYTLTVYVYKSGTSMGIQGVTVKIDGVSYITDYSGSV